MAAMAIPTALFHHWERSHAQLYGLHVVWPDHAEAKLSLEADGRDYVLFLWACGASILSDGVPDGLRRLAASRVSAFADAAEARRAFCEICMQLDGLAEVVYSEGWAKVLSGG